MDKCVDLPLTKTILYRSRNSEQTSIETGYLNNMKNIPQQRKDQYQTVPLVNSTNHLNKINGNS